MGYDKSRFPNGDVDEELICPICSSVLEEPLQAPVCEHAFCSDCIKEWLSRQNTCPIDRQPVSMVDLKPAPRILRNLLSRLSITCDNSQFGCNEVVRLESLASHRNECEFNPKRPVQCDKGCELFIPKDELNNHNCIKELRLYVEKETKRWEQQCNELKLCINSLRECLKQIMPESLHETSAMQYSIGIPIWCNSLPRARVLRWGGLISTPDNGLQEMVKKSLLDSGCPSLIVKDLVANSHETRWPPGLSSLEIRQINREVFDNYFCRKIPGHHAVVVMSCENQHMNDDMILEPGLIMIFAHGIEERT